MRVSDVIIMLEDSIHQAKLKKSTVPQLYLNGGTSVGGLQMPPQAPAPYLPKDLPEGKTHTLVLDLDETLVHYVEVPGTEGKYLTRPGAKEFLK